MSVYCLADFHLSNQVDKPMHKFGQEWEDHDRKIKENLQRVLTDADLLLIPGDVSWAINLYEAKKDLVFISELPGRKIRRLSCHYRLSRSDHSGRNRGQWLDAVARNPLFLSHGE